MDHIKHIIFSYLNIVFLIEKTLKFFKNLTISYEKVKKKTTPKLEQRLSNVMVETNKKLAHDAVFVNAVDGLEFSSLIRDCRSLLFKREFCP